MLNTAHLSDDDTVTVRWQTTTTEEYEQEFTVGELRAAIRSRAGLPEDTAPEDLDGNAGILTYSFLGDHENEPGSDVDVEREIL